MGFDLATWRLHTTGQHEHAEPAEPHEWQHDEAAQHACAWSRSIACRQLEPVVWLADNLRSTAALSCQWAHGAPLLAAADTEAPLLPHGGPGMEHFSVVDQSSQTRVAAFDQSCQTGGTLASTPVGSAHASTQTGAPTVVAPLSGKAPQRSHQARGGIESLLPARPLTIKDLPKRWPKRIALNIQRAFRLRERLIAGETLDAVERARVREALFQTENAMDFDYRTEDEENYSHDGEPIPGAIEYVQQRYAAAITRNTEDAYIRSAIEDEFITKLARRIDDRLFGERAEATEELSDWVDSLDCATAGI